MEQHLYLAHFGIKGQKWGVRRYQNPDGSYTAAGRERYGVNDPLKTKYSKNLQSGRVDHNKIEHPDLKKGTRIYRISSKQSDLGKSRLYVTYDEAKDRNYYLSGIWNPDKSDKLYEQYLEPVKDLKIASLPIVSKESAKIYGNDPSKVGEAFINAFAATRLSGDPSDVQKAYNKWDGSAKSLHNVKVNGYDAQSLSDYFSERVQVPKKYLYEDLMDKYSRNASALYKDAADAVNADPNAQKKLTKALKELGFDGQVDAAGLGHLESGQTTSERLAKNERNIAPAYGTVANDPLIIFDSKTNLKERAASAEVPKGTQSVAGALVTAEQTNRPIKISPKRTESLIRTTEASVKRLSSKAQAMKESGKTIDEIASSLGLSESYVKRYLYGMN